MPTGGRPKLLNGALLGSATIMWHWAARKVALTVRFPGHVNKLSGHFRKLRDIIDITRIAGDFPDMSEEFKCQGALWAPRAWGSRT